MNKILELFGIREPEFLISEHARDRLKQKLNISDRKINKLVVKVWQSKQSLSKKFNKVKYKKRFHGQNRACREYMGYVFVFAYNGALRGSKPCQKILITVI